MHFPSILKRAPLQAGVVGDSDTILSLSLFKFVVCIVIVFYDEGYYYLEGIGVGYIVVNNDYINQLIAILYLLQYLFL